VKQAKGLLDNQAQRPDVAVHVMLRERKDQDPLDFSQKVDMEFHCLRSLDVSFDIECLTFLWASCTCFQLGFQC
jgi:hypothetical protein